MLHSGAASQYGVSLIYGGFSVELHITLADYKAPPPTPCLQSYHPHRPVITVYTCIYLYLPVFHLYFPVFAIYQPRICHNLPLAPAPIDAPGYGATSEQPFANPQSPPQFQFPAFQEQAYTGAYQEQGFDNFDTSTINISDIGDIGDLLGIASQFGAGSYNAAGNMETN